MIVKRNWRDAHPTIAHQSGLDWRLLSSATKTSGDIEDPGLDPKCRCLKAITYVSYAKLQPSLSYEPNSELMNQYGVKAIFQFTQLNRERLTKLAEWVDQNHIKVNVDKTFSLDQAAKALDYQRDVHPRGKIVLNLRS